MATFVPVMRGLTIRIAPTLVYSGRVRDTALPACPIASVALKMGIAVVTSRRVSWLSSVTARGVATTRVSDSEFRNESTALTPCAFKNATLGANPPSEARLTTVLSRFATRDSVLDELVLDGG